MNYFNEYQNYLRDTKGFAESTIKHYSTEINGRIKAFAPNYVDNFCDLFDMPIYEAMSLINKLLQDEEFISHALPSHKAQVQGLKHYYKFLDSLDKTK